MGKLQGGKYQSGDNTKGQVDLDLLLTKAFEGVDVDFSGSISLGELKNMLKVSWYSIRRMFAFHCGFGEQGYFAVTQGCQAQRNRCGKGTKATTHTEKYKQSRQ